MQEKINAKGNILPKIKNISKIEEKIKKVNDNQIKNSLNNFLRAYNGKNK